MQLSTSKENFISNMQKDGYAVNWNDNQKILYLLLIKIYYKEKKINLDFQI